MSNEKIITVIKKARVWTGFFLSAGEITEELSWSFAPNQGILPVIHSSSAFGVFAAKYLNTNRVALPFLAMQGIAYLVDAILQFGLAAFEYPEAPVIPASQEKPMKLKGDLENSKLTALSMKALNIAASPENRLLSNSTEEKAKLIAPKSSIVVENHDKSAPVVLSKPQRRFAFYKRMMNGFVSLLSAFLIAALMTIILVATVKVLIIAYCVQSAVEISLITHKIGLNVQRYFSSQKAIDNSKEDTVELSKEHTNKTENKNPNIHKERKLEAQKNIVKQSTKLGVSFLIVALTVVSFLPIPIVAQAAQVGLVLIAIGFLVNLGIERYQKYKEQQAKVAEAIVNTPSNEKDPPNNTLTLAQTLEKKKAQTEEGKEPLIATADKNTNEQASTVTVVNGTAPAVADVGPSPVANITIPEKSVETYVINNNIANIATSGDNNSATSEEIYLNKCHMSKLNTQQYELILQNVKMQMRNTEGRCQQIENNLLPISVPTAAAAA